MMQKTWKMTSTRHIGTHLSTQRELSCEYQHDRFWMVFQKFCILDGSSLSIGRVEISSIILQYWFSLLSRLVRRLVVLLAALQEERWDIPFPCVRNEGWREGWSSMATTGLPSYGITSSSKGGMLMTWGANGGICINSIKIEDMSYKLGNVYKQ